MVGLDKAAAIPVALLHGDFAAERAGQLVAHGRRKAPEFDRRAVAAQRRHANRLLVGIDPDERVEIRQPRVIIIWVAHALDRLADLHAGEFEGSRPQDVLFIPARVLVEMRLLVDPVVGARQRRQKCVGREFQPEHRGRRVGGLDLVDHHEMALARAQHPFGREDDVLPARGNVISRQRRAVVKLDALSDLEGVGRVIRVDPDQDAVERRNRMNGRESRLAMRVEAWRRVGRDHIGESAALFRRIAGARRQGERE